jgi:hypothetical protein
VILDLDRVLEALSRKRSVFHSEADFQHALAVAIHDQEPRLNIRLEIPQGQGIALDMLLIDPASGERFALELKYRTTKWTGEVDDEEYRLKSHGADDIGSYDVLKDLMRVEALVDGGWAHAGAVVFITNDPIYWNRHPQRARRTNAHEFRVYEGLELSGVRSWGPDTGGSSRGREAPVVIRGTYRTDWLPFSRLPGAKGEFRVLHFHVTSA